MSNYYKYSFISPISLYALVKEELKSYYDTNAVDDLLFPIWTDGCLKRLGKGSYSIKPTVLEIKNYSARLPERFSSVREAWLCTSVESNYQLPGAHYLQVITKLDCPDVICGTCNDCESPDIIQAIYKSTMSVIAEFKRQYLLKPGNVTVQNEQCGQNCPNIGCDAPESFDIRDNKFVVTFPEGTVYLLFYAKDYDDQGNQLIPDDLYIQDYIEAFLKYKSFEMLCNQTTDETYNQIEKKKQDYERQADEALIIARTETKKETVFQKRDRIKKTMHRHDRFIIK